MRPFLLFLALSLLTACGGPNLDWEPAFDATDRGWLMNVWGPAADDLFMVGGALDAGRMQHFDGETATEVALPAGVPLINWGIGFAPDDIHAVGNEGTILHFDGAAWTEVASPTTQDLWGVWGSSANDVWAVGGSARLPDGVPTIVHYDGSAWTLTDLSALGLMMGPRALFKVWGSGASDVYAVGDAGIMLHWNGAAWEELMVGADDDLIAVWGTGPDNIVAVGGRANGIIAHWNGTEWRTESLSPLPGFNGVWMRAPGRAHVVGARAMLGTFDLETFTMEEQLVPEARDFHAVHGVDGVLTTVGGNLAVPMAPEGVAYRRQLGSDE